MGKQQQAYYFTVVITPDAPRAAEYDKTGNLPEPTDPPTTCFAAASHTIMLNQQPGGVLDVSTRRLVKQGDRATLIDRKVWVDTRTKGSRLAHETAVTYQLLSKGPRGVEVYGARSNGSLHVVVSGPTTRSRTSSFQSPKGGPMDACGVFVATVPSTAGGGTLTMVGDVVFEGPSPDNLEPDDALKAAPEEKLAHLRTLVVAVSVSQTTSEREPSISVNYAWHGKGRTFDRRRQGVARHPRHRMEDIIE